LLQLHFVIAALTWKLVLGLSGSRVSYRDAYVIHYMSQLGKYIPGKFWAALGKVGFSTRAGVPASAASHGIILETILVMASVMLLLLPLVPPIAADLGVGPIISTAIVVSGVALLLFLGHPAVLGRLLGLVSRLMKQDIAWDHPDIMAIVRLIPVYMLMFLVMGASFQLFAMSFGVELHLWPGILVFPAAVAIGFAFLPAPGGLGVRELSLVWLLGLVMGITGSGPLPEGQAEVVTIAARIWITLGELVAFLIALAVRGKPRKAGIASANRDAG
jgi:hypothetical protein